MISKPVKKIGIVGIGYVGGTLRHWFEKKGYPLFLYDKYKKIGSLGKVNQAEIIFICLPTPFLEENQRYDQTAVEELMSSLKGKKIIVIKSTVLPGLTDKLQKKYPSPKIVFVPEFLREKYAIEDFLHPQRNIVGYTSKSQDIAKEILKILPPAPIEKIIPAKEAEMVKFFSNTFLAVKVIFANQMYDLCQKLGIDYDTVKEVAGADKRIGKSHFDIFQDGYRGYAGSCLPKDTKALIKFAQDLGIDLKLLKTVEEINKDIKLSD